MTAKVPVSIHESFIEKYFASDPETGERIDDGDLDALADAMRKSREVCEKAAEATAQIMASPMHTPMANAKRARDAGFDLMFKATRKIDSARERAEATVNRLRAATNAPPAPKDAIEALLHQEIRAAMLRLKDDARVAALNAAINSGDNVTVAAVLHGPEILAGFTKSARDVYREVWRRKNFPEQIDRIDRLERAIAAMERAAPLLLGFVDGLTNAAEISAADALEQGALAAMEAAK